MLYLCKKVRIMFQDNEYIGFVTYTQGKRNRKIPFGIVSQSYKQKAIVTHYSRKIRKNLIAIEDKRYFSHLGIYKINIKSLIYEYQSSKNHTRRKHHNTTVSSQSIRRPFYNLSSKDKRNTVCYILRERTHKRRDLRFIF